MAPPHKRRRLTLDNEVDMNMCEDEEMTQFAHSSGYSHGVEHLTHSTHAHTSAHLRPVPQQISEIHLKIQQRAVEIPDAWRLRPRQDTAGSSGATLGVSVEVSVDLSGSTTATSTSTNSGSGPTAYAATSTSTAASSASSSTSSGAASSGAASSSNSSTSGSTSSPSDSLSTSSSSNSSSPSTSSSSSSSSSSLSSSGSSTVQGTGVGSTGLTSTGTGPTSTGSNSNSTITTSGSTTTSATPSANLTTSAIILVGNGTTTTSQTTIDLSVGSSRSSTTSSSASSSASSSPSSSPSSSTYGGFVYLATLGDGTVETITRHSSAYVTTFSGDVTSTISAYSSSSNSGVTSTMLQTTTMSGSSNAQSTITSTTDIGGAGGGSVTTTSAASSSTGLDAGSSGGGGGTNSATTGAIAGGVVGGAAGIALLLLAALLFLKWWRRNKMAGGHQALPANSGMTADEDHPAGFSRGPGMAERAGLMPAAFGAVPAFFRHQNRSAAPTESEPSERGFTRVSGRKLPSSFSPGMTGPPPDMPLTRPDRNLSGTSFYRDSGGLYGGDGSSPEETAAVEAGAMTLSPGPQRRPTVHAPGPYTMSPTNTASSPRSPPGTGGTAATFDRSDTPSSLDPNRGSRFQENVDI